MPILWNLISANSNGGTELLCRRLEAYLPTELLNEVQIIPSRLYGDLDPTKIRVLWLHDLPGDPESDKVLLNDGWKRFHKIVCVSNWQQQRYSEQYNIPPSQFIVIPNSINPIERTRDWMSGKQIKFIYHTTPHRGLEILYYVFDKLAEKYPGIHLDVYSSFNAYGWPGRDVPYKDLFSAIEQHPKMTYHGFQENSVVRKALADADVFAYPNIWPETSCMALMEAMSAGLLCVHPNLAALYETGANWTLQYQFHEDPQQHAMQIYSILDGFLASDKEMYRQQIANASGYANIFYNWNSRSSQWTNVLNSLLSLPREFPEATFTYRA